MSRGQGAALRSSADILAGSTARSDMPAATDPAERSDLLCGVFMVRDAAMNPLFAALPPSIRLPVAADPRASIARVAALLEQEVVAGRGQGFVACRLLEIFFAAAVEAIAERDGATRPGWFRALADPRLAPAITALHADPSRAWSVDLLASTAALSPSRFAARFRAAMGESAMAYVARIRMARACRMLRTNNGTLAEVAAGVGYGDPAAFARAFRAMVGTSPGRWRRDAKVSDGNG